METSSSDSGTKFGAFKMSVSTSRRVVLKQSDSALAADEQHEKGVSEAAALPISAVEDRILKGADGVELDKKAGPLVIPMLANNDWRGARSKMSWAPNKDDNSVTDEKVKGDKIKDNVEVPPATAAENAGDLKEQAKAELLREARGDPISEAQPAISDIPLLMRNRVPDGFETDDKLDVSLRPEASEVSDYDSVPISEFGLAMLRGMGWQDGAPIGRTNKQVVKAKIPDLRPKGLGLGADRSLAAQANGALKTGDQRQEQLKMAPGAFVVLTSGAKKGMYGKVQSLDVDNSRAVVELALGGLSVSCSQFNLQLVDSATYDKFSKCINAENYTKYKRLRDIELASANGVGSDSDVSTKSKKKKKEKRPPSVEPIDVPSTSRVWARPDLRVRVVDNKNPRYKQKVRVLDVNSIDCCSCRTDDGTIITLSQSDLETVLPRGRDALVLVFKRRKKDKPARVRLAKLIESDRKKCVASVQYCGGNQRCDSVDFDDLCEFVGNPNDYEEY